MAQLNDLLVMGQSTLLGPVNIQNNFEFNKILSDNGDKTGWKTMLTIKGPTYDPSGSKHQNSLKIAYGDPGPQIVFDCDDGQRAALIFNQYDSMVSSVPGTSLSLVSSDRDATFITDNLVMRNDTGKRNLCNSLLNSLSDGTSDPTGNDYYISQYAGGGTTTTTFHRRPVSKLWNYIKTQADTQYVKASLSGTTLTITIP